MTPALELGPIPLNIGTRDRPSNAPFPDELPFTVGLDDFSGLVTQAFNPRIAAILDQVYAHGSQLGTPMNDYGLGKSTCDDFITFVLSTLAVQDLRGMKTLEIGCGTGYLLARLHALGAETLGIEPGVSSSAHAESAGIRVIHEPFDRVELRDGFDLILHTGVLEHVQTPIAFLRRQLSLLSPGGRIAFAVPDCEAPLAHGDLSMFVHEHWSYFTHSSVANLVAAAGGSASVIQKAGVGGALYVYMERSGSSASLTNRAANAVEDPGAFAERALRGKLALTDYFAQRRQRTIGVYCPGRFLNYWRVANAAQLRFFDDDVALHRRYFPPMPVPIEPRASLLAQPVDSLLIMSRSFGESLSNALRDNTALSACEITTVQQLF